MFNARKQTRKTLAKFQKSSRTKDAIMGRSDGVVAVPNVPYAVYVRDTATSIPYVVYNFRMPLVKGLPVKIGEDPSMKGITQVLSLRWNPGTNLSSIPILVSHAVSHLVGGADPVYIMDNQVLPLLCYATTGMNIQVNAGWITFQNSILRVSQTTLDLTTSIPVSGARYTLIRVSNIGVVSIQDGTPVSSVVDLGTSNIPVCETGYTPIAFVRLYTGMTSFSLSNTNPDVTMVVWGGSLFDTATLDASDMTYTPAVLTDWDSNADPGEADDAFDQLAERTKKTEVVFTNMVEPTGFVNRTDSTLSFVDGTLTFSIAPAVTSFDIYASGIKITISTTKTVPIANTAGSHFIYFDAAGVLTESTDVWGMAENVIPVAVIYWDGSAGLIQDERHGIQMDGLTHEYLHETRGSAFAFGLAGTFAANGSTITIGPGEWYDEDIEWKTIADTTQCRVFYLDGTTWKWSALQNAYFTAVSSVPQYNNSGVLANVDVSKYSISWVYATNFTASPVAVIMGQAQYNTLALAAAASVPVLTTLPAQEMVLLYKVIWQRDGAVIAWKRTDDYRKLGGPAADYTATDHGALAGLFDQDHPASAIFTDTTNFNNNLTAADTTVQLALESIDALIMGSAGALDSLTDVNAPSPNDGEVLTWDATPGEWVSAAIPAAPALAQQVIFTVEGTLAVATGVLKLPNVTGRTLTISKVYLIVGTAPVGASIIVDIHKNGTTLFTTQGNRPAITTTNTTGQSTTLDITSWGDGSYLTMDIDQVGTAGTEGSDLTVVIVYQ